MHVLILPVILTLFSCWVRANAHSRVRYGSSAHLQMRLLTAQLDVGFHRLQRDPDRLLPVTALILRAAQVIGLVGE